MADLDQLCDLLDEETEEAPQNETSEVVDEDEAELQAMLERVKAMKAKVAAKKKALSEVDIFQKAPEPSPQSPFLEKPNKPIQLHPQTPAFGPARPVTSSRVITGKEKEELLAKMKASDERVVQNDLELSSDEEEAARNPMEQHYNESGRQLKKQLESGAQISSFVREENNKKVGFSEIQGSSINLSNASQNKKLPSNVLVEKHSKIRINNPKVTQAQMDLNLIDRSFISIFRLQSAIFRKEMEGRDWSTIGIIFYKNVQTSKSGNTYTMWKMTDLNGGEPTVITVMLFGRAHAVHYKMPMNKVVGLLNPKVLESREGGGSSATLSVDHPDKVMEMGDGLDVGRCKGTKHDGSVCNNLVNMAQCEFCTYHIKKAYKSMSAKRADLQSSFSGPSNPRSRIMSKIAPKGEIFAGGQVLNNMNPRAAKADPKLKLKDAQALRSLGVIPSEVNAELSKQKTLARKNILTEASSSSLVSSLEKEAMKKALDQGVSEDLVSKLLMPSPGSRVLLKHMTKNAEIKEEKEAITKGTNITAKSLLKDHQNKLKMEAQARKAIEERKKLAQINIASVPKLGKGLSSNDGFIDLSSSSPSNGSKVKALLALKGKTIPKVNPNGVKRKRLPEESLQSSKEKVAKVIQAQQGSPSTSSSTRPALRGINGALMDEAKLEALKKMKSRNAGLAEEEETHQREKYFDVLEKKDAMEDKMINTKEVQVKAVTCPICEYTAYSQSELCKERQHKVKFASALKKFFECSKCGNRTTSLDKYPKTTCEKCGSSGWKRAGMMKEKKAVLEHEKLVIRGLEQKFIGAHTSSSKMDLDSIN